MSHWTSKKTAKILAFYIVNLAIIAVALPILLEVWGLFDAGIRNKVLVTITVVVFAGLGIAGTNYLFSAMEEDAFEAKPPPDDGGRDLGDALRKAKMSADEE